VYVNGRELLLDIPLNDGDKIKIWQTTLVYLAVDHADASAAMAAAKKKDEWARSTMMGNE